MDVLLLNKQLLLCSPKVSFQSSLWNMKIQAHILQQVHTALIVFLMIYQECSFRLNFWSRPSAQYFTDSLNGISLNKHKNFYYYLFICYSVQGSEILLKYKVMYWNCRWKSIEIHLNIFAYLYFLNSNYFSQTGVYVCIHVCTHICVWLCITVFP